MLEPIWQQSLLENLGKSPIWKTLVSNYLELAVFMDDSPASRQKCTKVKMEPYLDSCYNQNNTTTMCDIPFHTTANTLIYCQTDAFADATHKANVCTDTKYESYMDKQRYKAIRKWKRIEKGKAHYLFLFQTLNFQIFQILCARVCVYVRGARLCVTFT